MAICRLSYLQIYTMVYHYWYTSIPTTIIHQPCTTYRPSAGTCMYSLVMHDTTHTHTHTHTHTYTHTYTIVYRDVHCTLYNTQCTLYTYTRLLFNTSTVIRQARALLTTLIGQIVITSDFMYLPRYRYYRLHR